MAKIQKREEDLLCGSRAITDAIVCGIKKAPSFNRWGFQ
jgi:hypothetical protein